MEIFEYGLHSNKCIEMWVGDQFLTPSDARLVGEPNILICAISKRNPRVIKVSL